MSVRCRAPATGPNKHFRGLPSVGFARCSGTMEGPGGRGIFFVTAHPTWQTTLYPECQIPCGRAQCALKMDHVLTQGEM